MKPTKVPILIPISGIILLIPFGISSSSFSFHSFFNSFPNSFPNSSPNSFSYFQEDSSNRGNTHDHRDHSRSDGSVRLAANVGHSESVESHRGFSTTLIQPLTTATTTTLTENKWAILRAFIRTIYCAEGTYDCYPGRDNHYRTRGVGNPDGISGYHLIFGGQVVEDLSRHPDICVSFNWNGRRDCSTAAGAAQWLTDTWENNLANCPIAADQSFEPYNQDLVLLCLLNNIGVLDIDYSKTPAVISADSKLFHAVQSLEGFKDLSDAILSRKWASFPCFTGTDHFGSPCNGTSYYSQGGKTIEELWEIYNQELERELNDRSHD